MNLEKHWNNIFEKIDDKDLGWWENEISQTLNFLNQIDINDNSRVFLAGAGTSILVDELQKKNCNLILNDISSIALEKLESRLKYNSKIEFFHYNLANHFLIKEIDIWIDRAVLHFLINKEDIQIYFENLNNNLKIGSFVLFAQFRIGGPSSCASLKIKQYDINEFSEKLGIKFQLLRNEEYDFVNPWGNKKKYIYALYQKIS
jgi:hypothetical protein